ncbi:IS3 family transposase [Phascolarctobacterium succinatutens]|uniref:IS3 family transposase n=1 Tax=Phascolarctobacterium succinatutens TaxID=626940 RepID=UPI0034C5C319
MRSSNSSAVAEYIDYYNNRRIQAKAKWMPPSKFREASMYSTKHHLKASSRYLYNLTAGLFLVYL